MDETFSVVGSANAKSFRCAKNRLIEIKETQKTFQLCLCLGIRHRCQRRRLRSVEISVPGRTTWPSYLIFSTKIMHLRGFNFTLPASNADSFSSI